MNSSDAPPVAQDPFLLNGHFPGSSASDISPEFPSPGLLGPPGAPASASPSRGFRNLSALGPGCLVKQAIADWFIYIQPLTPILHRRRFLFRLYDGEADSNPAFLALVISVVAVASSSSSVGHVEPPGYSKVTPLRCAELIYDNNLLRSDVCTVDWFVAHYNIAYALVGCLGPRDWRVFRAIKNSMAGVHWFLFYNTEKKTIHDEEMSKRLYALSAWDLYVPLPYLVLDIF